MFWYIKSLGLSAAMLACLSSSSPLNPFTSGVDDVGLSATVVARLDAAGAERVPLRIMPFGASIMSGFGSVTGDGCRRYLRNKLRHDGWEVDMVGSRHGGRMKDNDHEAKPGDLIADAEKRLPNSLVYKPNVVIINLGTNDAVRNEDVQNAGKRMNALLDRIWNADGMSQTCVMLSTLIPTSNPEGNKHRPSINDQYRRLVQTRWSKGKCIYLAEMAPPSKEWFDLNGDDYLPKEEKKVHPSDKGHKKMAAMFYQAINDAQADGRLVKPAEFDGGKPYCDKFEGSGTDAGGLTQRGSGWDDGVYNHNSKEMGVIWEHTSAWDRNQWKFARLFHSDYDDLVAWIGNGGGKPNVYATWANSADGQGKFTMIEDMQSNIDCPSADGVIFIDLNGDGLDDLVCIGNQGELYASINQGNGNAKARKPPSFQNIGKVKGSETGDRRNVFISDIDGDGRGDYGVIADDGTLTFWRNGGTGDKPGYWQPLGVIREVPASERPSGSHGQYRGVDLNGDGRGDFLTVDEWGKTITHTNSQSCRKGKVGNGLKVAWRAGQLRGSNTGAVTHLGLKGYLGDGAKAPGQERFHFARIYGQASAFGNEPKRDYVFIQHTNADTKHKFQMKVWKNTGEGGTKVKVDGNKYCNMMGHKDGSEDYVWTFQGGEMKLFVNRGKKEVTYNDREGFWQDVGTIWKPPRGMHRKDLHLADWDGDGDCDIIYVDPENNNAIEVWINEKPGSWQWRYIPDAAPGVTCPEKRGVGLHDLAVRFADLTGNKRADQLCIKPNGEVSAHLQSNDGRSWENAGQIKFSEGKDRANLRWADVNGDGKDDMIWIEKFSGDSWVWYNEGRGSPSTGGGSSFYWRRRDEKAYAGLAAGTCIFYPDLDGNSHADEHYISQSFNNIARTSMSPPCRLADATGNDDDKDEEFPTVPEKCFSTVKHNEVRGFTESAEGESDRALHLRFQPVLRVEDGCVPFPSVQDDGSVSGGLEKTGDMNGMCSKNEGQIYSRSRDYNGMHAIMYSWYMPKDQNVDGGGSIGHRHEWENVIVWLSSRDDPKVKGISYSQHSGYLVHSYKYPLTWDGDTPKVNYARYDSLTHSLASTSDRGGKQPLISWHSLTPRARFTLNNYDFGDANVPFTSTDFLRKLEKGKLV